MGLDEFNSLGEYCDPHTAFSVFLILLLVDIPYRPVYGPYLDSAFRNPGLAPDIYLVVKPFN